MLFQALALSVLASCTLASPYRRIGRDYGTYPPDNTTAYTTSEASLPACGPDSTTCQCPENSFFQQSSSYAFCPVRAAEITALTANFLGTEWFGTAPVKTDGNGTTVGAVRYLQAELPGGKNMETVTERLTQLTFNPDGGYYMKFQMNEVLSYDKTDGSLGLLGGSWDFTDVREINRMTYLLWNVRVCFSDLYDLGGFHESAMKNVTAVLKALNKMPQDSQMIGPITF